MSEAIYFDSIHRDQYIMRGHESHEAIEVYYLIAGKRMYFVENRAYELEAGTLILIGSHRIHKTVAMEAQGHERMLLEIPSAFIRQWRAIFPEVSLNYVFQHPAVLCTTASSVNGEMQALMQRIQRLRQRRPYGYDAQVRCETFQLLLLFARCVAETGVPPQAMSSAKHDKVYEVAEYLSAHLEEEIALDDLCARFFISKYYLCHSFREVTGLSLMAFLYAARIRKACALLTEENWSVTRIAQQTGFGSATHFSSVFKKQMGKTPREYRGATDGLTRPVY